MKRRKHYVVFGAGGIPDKGVLGMKSRQMSGYELHVLQLRNDGKYEYGDNFEIDDIDGEYTTLYFAKKDSLKSFIKSCEALLQMWEHKDAAEHQSS